MQYVKLGNTGLDVSRLCLGSMGFGDPAWVHKWVLEEDAARPVIRHAVEAGFLRRKAYQMAESGGAAPEQRNELGITQHGLQRIRVQMGSFWA